MTARSEEEYSTHFAPNPCLYNSDEANIDYDPVTWLLPCDAIEY